MILSNSTNVNAVQLRVKLISSFVTTISTVYPIIQPTYSDDKIAFMIKKKRLKEQKTPSPGLEPGLSGESRVS